MPFALSPEPPYAWECRICGVTATAADAEPLPTPKTGPPRSRWQTEVMALAGRYGPQFGQPDWLPGLIGQYHLTPPPGA